MRKLTEMLIDAALREGKEFPIEKATEVENDLDLEDKVLRSGVVTGLPVRQYEA